MAQKQMAIIFYQETIKKQTKIVRYCISNTINLTEDEVICLDASMLSKKYVKGPDQQPTKQM